MFQATCKKTKLKRLRVLVTEKLFEKIFTSKIVTTDYLCNKKDLVAAKFIMLEKTNDVHKSIHISNSSKNFPTPFLL